MLTAPKARGARLVPELFFFAPVGVAFVFCFVYWAYLLFASQMVIVFDAMVYEELGRMLSHSGWIEYFKTGPHNEPFYPLLIAFSMRLADHFSVSYQKIQTILQILMLFFTQLLTLTVLRRLNISRGIIALTILYLGISPALINATFVLFSEIAIFPFMLGIVLIGVKCWEVILNNDYKGIILWGACLALVFIVITSTKALFEYIFIVFMAPYLFLAGKSIISQKRKIFTGALLFISTAAVLFNAFLFSYKSLNQKYNGHFMMADRGPYILYGNVAKRSEPLSLNCFWAGVAFVAGDGVCYKFFDKNDCYFWSIFTVEKYGRPKLYELESRGVPDSEIDSALVNLAKGKMLETPFQQMLLMFIESFKMLFWESTKVGYVDYPSWLQALFGVTLFKNSLRLLVFLLTFASVGYVLRYVLKRRKQVFGDLDPQDRQTHILFFILTLVLSYTGFYSFFMINTRYASPLASLYLILVAFTAQKIVSRNNGREAGPHES